MADVLCLALAFLVIAGMITSAADLLGTLSSDKFYLVSLYDDVLGSGYDLTSWKLPPSPYVFPDMLLLMSFLTVTSDIGHAFVAYSIAAVLLLLGGVVAATQTGGAPLRMRLMWVLAGGLLLIALSQTRVYAQGLFHLLVHPVFHGGCVIVGWWLVAGTMRGSRAGYSVRLAAALLALTFLITLSDRLVLAQIFFPLVLTIATLWALGWTEFRSVWLTAVIGVVSYTGAVAVWRAVDALELIGLERLPELGDYGENLSLAPKVAQFYLEHYMRALTGLFVCMLLAVAAAVAVLAASRKSFLTRRTKLDVPRDVYCGVFLVTFAFFAVLGTILGPLAANIPFVDRTGAIVLGRLRYLQPLHLMPPMLLVGLGACFARRLPRPLHYGVAVLALGFGAAQIVPELRRFTPGDLELPYPDRVRCVDELAAEERLEYGFASYHLARYLTYLSRAGIRVNQITANLNVRHQISNLAWYAKPGSREEYPEYSFIVTDELDRGKIVDRFGAPASARYCDDIEVLVYNRPSDIRFREFVRELRSVPPETAKEYFSQLRLTRDTLRAGDASSAAAHADKAIALAPKAFEARVWLARAYRALGRLEEARSELDRAAALAPRTPRAMHLLGNTYASLGDTERADELYEEGLRIDPSNESLRTVLRHRLRASGRTAAAEEDAEVMRSEGSIP